MPKVIQLAEVTVGDFPNVTDFVHGAISANSGGKRQDAEREIIPNKLLKNIVQADKDLARLFQKSSDRFQAGGAFDDGDTSFKRRTFTNDIMVIQDLIY